MVPEKILNFLCVELPQNVEKRFLSFTILHLEVFEKIEVKFFRLILEAYLGSYQTSMRKFHLSIKGFSH